MNIYKVYTQVDKIISHNGWAYELIQISKLIRPSNKLRWAPLRQTPLRHLVWLIWLLNQGGFSFLREAACLFNKGGGLYEVRIGIMGVVDLWILHSRIILIDACKMKGLYGLILTIRECLEDPFLADFLATKELSLHKIQRQNHILEVLFLTCIFNNSSV